MRIICVPILAIALSACSAAEGDGPNGEIKMNAGKWSQTMTIEKFELPGAPPEAEEMLQQMIGQTQTNESCLTEDEVAKGFEEQAKQSMAGQACDTESFSAKGGELTGKITCQEPNGAGAVMTVEGDYTADSMDMTLTADISDPSMPDGNGTMVMVMTGKRLGECDA
ncbi:MAG: DUF3617 domain-containing protein [Pontixanthobacter sp.]